MMKDPLHHRTDHIYALNKPKFLTMTGVQILKEKVFYLLGFLNYEVLGLLEDIYINTDFFSVGEEEARSELKRDPLW